MSHERLPIDSISTTLRRLELCAYAVQEVHVQLEQPENPEHKADLILTTEKLVSEVIDLYHTVRIYVWGEKSEDEFFISSKDEEDS